jgi:DNA-binding winged helix-turn-helix (wHTH) protein
MSRDSYTVYKVFIASPGDVLRERKIAYKVMAEVNQIFEDQNKPYHLEVYAWERHVYPDLGRPQEVILKQIPIDQCDIFIGAFWKRFGTPPGGRRPHDNKPYLSGTEQEIDEAIEARKKNVNGQPIIMLYRKMDLLPEDMSEDDHLQYAQVIKYFRQFEPGGEHPALVIEFRGNEFRRKLRSHLLKVVAKLEKDDIDRRVELQVKAVPSPDESDPQLMWLKRIGLLKNPFQFYLAEDEDEQFLPRYFVPSGELRLQDLIDERNPWVILGDTGRGKTALRMMIAARCFPHEPQSEVLCIELGCKELETVLEWAGGDLGGLESFHYIQTIAQSTVKVIQARSGDLRLGNSVRLEDLAAAVGSAGFRHLLCLVDQVDELTAVQGRPEKMARLLAPLMVPALRTAQGMAFRYFLPGFLGPLLQSQPAVFRLDRCRVTRLEWTEQSLRRLIGQRMRFFSQDQRAPYVSLGQLCEGRDGFAETIDAEVARLAEGSPRAAIWLAGRLIQRHCQAEEPPWLIRPETWESVKVDWWLGGRADMFGAPVISDGLRLVGDRIFFQDREIVLSTRYHALLQRLVQANGKVCATAELRGAWAGENPEGVSDRAITEAVRRMKIELKERGVDPGWIETVRGRGYRIRTPETGGPQTIPDSEAEW